MVSSSMSTSRAAAALDGHLVAQWAARRMAPSVGAVRCTRRRSQLQQSLDREEEGKRRRRRRILIN
jgi:hypothetical protein